jgi:hypothetical protein
MGFLDELRYEFTNFLVACLWIEKALVIERRVAAECRQGDQGEPDRGQQIDASVVGFRQSVLQYIQRWFSGPNNSARLVAQRPAIKGVIAIFAMPADNILPIKKLISCVL